MTVPQKVMIESPQRQVPYQNDYTHVSPIVVIVASHYRVFV